MIGGVCIALLPGKIYAIYNAKEIYIAQNIIFLAASALCGAAPNMPAEIVGRVFAGAGGNGMYFGLLLLMSINTTDSKRPMCLSLTYVILRSPMLPFG
jgi:MFS family permease